MLGITFSVLILLNITGQIFSIYCPDDENDENNDQHFSCVIFSNLSKPKRNPLKNCPPRINLTKSIVDIPTNSTFEVHCIGNKPLQWAIGHDDEDMAERMKITESHDSQKENNGYSSKLVLSNTQWSDSTIIACGYNNSYNSWISLKPDMMTSFYLFVNDDDQILVTKSNWLHASMSSPLVIPCRTTNSQAKVALIKIQDSDTIEVALEKDRVEYDNLRGFTIFYPTIFYEGSFECKATLANKTEIETVIIIYIPSLPGTVGLPAPIIDASNASRVVVNSSFSLKCQVDFEVPPENTDLFWLYPDSGYEPERYSILKTSQESITLNNQTFTRWSKTLIIREAQMIDEGEYVCELENHDFTNSKSLNVTIYEEEPHECDQVLSPSSSSNYKYFTIFNAGAITVISIVSNKVFNFV